MMKTSRVLLHKSTRLEHNQLKVDKITMSTLCSSVEGERGEIRAVSLIVAALRFNSPSFREAEGLIINE